MQECQVSLVRPVKQFNFQHLAFGRGIVRLDPFDPVGMSTGAPNRSWHEVQPAARSHTCMQMEGRLSSHQAMQTMCTGYLQYRSRTRSSG